MPFFWLEVIFYCFVIEEDYRQGGMIDAWASVSRGLEIQEGLKASRFLSNLSLKLSPRDNTELAHASVPDLEY